jgi:hypothetical protein
MKDFIKGFGHGVLELFGMPFSFLISGDVNSIKSDTNKKEAIGREYITYPDYQPPIEEIPTITREENKNE